MFNVLPQSIKINIARSYKERRIVVWLVMCGILVLSMFVGLIPSYVYLIFQEKNIVAENAAMKSATATSSVKGVDVQSIIHNNDTLLTVLNANLYQGSLHEALARIGTLKGKDILLNRITYTSDLSVSPKAGATLTLQGIAGTREGLLAFKNRLENDPRLSKVNLPVSSFAKSTHINFSLTVYEK